MALIKIKSESMNLADDYAFTGTVSGAGIFESQLLHVREEQPSGTGAGTAISGYNTRNLNTIITNEITGASLSSNQITLPSGTYFILSYAPVYKVNRFKTVLYNITDSSFEVIGTGGYSRDSAPSVELSWGIGRFTISSSKVFELQSYCQTADTNPGALGFGGDDGNVMVYADVHIWKVA